MANANKASKMTEQTNETQAAAAIAPVAAVETTPVVVAPKKSPAERLEELTNKLINKVSLTVEELQEFATLPSKIQEINSKSEAKALELKATTPPAADQPPLSPAEHWQEKERQFRQRQIENQKAKPQEEAAASKPPKSLSGGVEDGSDASRCNLARDVLSGAVRHGNGKPTDKYDREIAENDVRRYCR